MRRAALVLALLATSCSKPVVALPHASAEPKGVTVRQPTTAEELQLGRDAHGRLYDTTVDADATVETRPYGVLDIAGGQVRTLDGNALAIYPGGEETGKADFGGVEHLQVTIVWEKISRYPGESVLGVEIGIPGADPVAHWGRFRQAYGTDGGQGGITSALVIQRANAVDYEHWTEPDTDINADLSPLDLDGRRGNDSLVFNNGFGDGGFPMSEGRDAAGKLVQLMIWDPRFPWRIAVPVGTPPPDISEREDQLAQCIAGTRPVTIYAKDNTICT